MSGEIMKDNSFNLSNSAWPTSLALITVLGSLALACVFPFAAVAALAALTLRPLPGLALIVLVWALNQATGFFLMSFPWDGQAVGHGIAILLATAAAFGTAKFAIGKVRNRNGVLRGVAALLWAFAIYQLLLRAYASVGGGAENFSAEIISAVAANDALWFAGLLALRFLIGQFTDRNSQVAAA